MQLSYRQIARPAASACRWSPSNAHRAAPISLLRCSAAPSAADAASLSSTSTLPSSSPLHTVPEPSPLPLNRSNGALVPAIAAADATIGMPFYCQFPLDRRAEWRRDATLLDSLFTRSDAKLIPLLRDKVLVRPNTSAPATSHPSPTTQPRLQPVLLCPAAADNDLTTGSPARIFLGTDATGAPYFAAAVHSLAAAKRLAAAHSGAEWRSARLAGPDLAPGDASLLATASSLMTWHATNGYCAVTGAPSQPSSGGFARRCIPGSSPSSTRSSTVSDVGGVRHDTGSTSSSSATATTTTTSSTCNTSTSSNSPSGSSTTTSSSSSTTGSSSDSAYPRIDPAVIMLVSYGDFALLGRKAEWPPDRYSTLAGFLEVGEALEAAVVREVAEEAAVAVDPASPAYAASQPWPFPRSLMLGFFATAQPAGVAAAAAAARAAASAPAAPGSSGSSNNNGTTSPSGLHAASSSSSSASSSSAAAAAPAARQWWQPAPEGSSGFDLLPPPGRRAALGAGVFAEDVAAVLGPLQQLQWPAADREELQDVRWFHRDWIRAVLAAQQQQQQTQEGAQDTSQQEGVGAGGEAAGGSWWGGSGGVPGAGGFSVPGSHSLAHRLITSWAGCGGAAGAAAAGAASNGTSSRTSNSSAANGSSNCSSSSGWEGDGVPQVLLSGSGTFKYVLMRLWDASPAPTGAAERSKLLVWGDVRAPYHNDVLQQAKSLARALGGSLRVTPLGGGRMRHDPAARQVEVYGYSAAFGPAPHELAAALVHRWYPLYDKESITVSYEGY